MQGQVKMFFQTPGPSNLFRKPMSYEAFSPRWRLYALNKAKAGNWQVSLWSHSLGAITVLQMSTKTLNPQSFNLQLGWKLFLWIFSNIFHWVVV